MTQFRGYIYIMASVFGRRVFCRNLLKLRLVSDVAVQPRCLSVFACKRLQLRPPQYTISCSQYQVRAFSGENGAKRPSVFQRFKQMYKDYWYVLVPVHLVTSAAWFGGFYYLAKSGVDIVALLEGLHISDKIINPLKDSSMGYIAVSYALYKIATPARYTVTLGGTTISINYLKKWGYIKPAPSPERLKEIVLERKENFMESVRETRDEIKIQTDKLKDKKENIIEDFDKSIKQIKELGDKIKNKEHIVEELKKIKKVKE